jgi:signal transduction histidine kinase
MAKQILASDFFESAIRSLNIEHGAPASRSPHKANNGLEIRSWLAAPCLIDAIDLGAAKKAASFTKMAFLVFVTLGRSDTEYLGRGYSPTDIRIAEILCSIVSAHIPVAVTSKYMRAIPEVFVRGAARHKSEGEFNQKSRSQEADDPTEYLSRAAAQLKLNIRTIIQANDVDGDSEPEFHSNQPLDEKFKRALAKTLSKINPAKRSNSPKVLRLFEERYLAWDISTEFSSHRFLLFGMGTKVIPQYLYQILIAFVENYYLYLRAIDFYNQQTSTLAQIRHAVRGPITAAATLLDLLASRYARYSAMPGKLSQLMELPSVRHGIPDALYWINEAYLIVDSARYLLGAIRAEDVRWANVDIFTVVNTVLNALTGEISRRDLKIFLSIDGQPKDRFESDVQFFVAADRMLIWTVIFNLIDNAVKYSHAGRRIGIYLEHLDDGKKWRFAVENYGVPIYSGEKKIIFQPWVRSRMKDVGRRRPGTGLGLAVSQAILEAHGLKQGDFDCDSDPVSKRTLLYRTVFFFRLGLKGDAPYDDRRDSNAVAHLPR